MTTTTVEESAPPAPAPVLPCDGQMACDVCGTVYTHTIILDHTSLTARQQLRQAASRAGWRLTFDGRDVCPTDAAGNAAFLIPGWTDFWSPEKAIVPMQRDPEETAVMPAVVDDEDAPRSHPYKETPQ